jgi:hypothetical protein
LWLRRVCGSVVAVDGEDVAGDGHRDHRSAFVGAQEPLARGLHRATPMHGFWPGDGPRTCCFTIVAAMQAGGLWAPAQHPGAVIFHHQIVTIMHEAPNASAEAPPGPLT